MVLWKILPEVYKYFFGDSFSWNKRKAFLWENIIVFSSSFLPEVWKIFSRENFFQFLTLGWKVQGSISRNVKHFLGLGLESYISWNIRNFFLKKVSVSWKLESYSSKYKKRFQSRFFTKRFWWSSLKVQGFISGNKRICLKFV